jgi:uncharacterized protein
MSEGESVGPEGESAFRREAVWFAWLLAWVSGVWLISALLAPTVYELVAPLFPEAQRFSRVARRVATVIAIVGLWIWVRRWGALSWSGIGLPAGTGGSGRFLRSLGVGALAGGSVLLVESMAGTWTWSFELTIVDLLEAAIGGILIGLLEESVFRGFLLLARRPLAPAAWAFRVAVISLLYSAAHFARGGKSREHPGAMAGFEVWSRIPGSIAEQIDAFFGLAALGLLFAALAFRDGDCWRAAGAHAGIVGGIRVASELFEPVPGRSSILLSGSIQPGWGAVVLLVLASLVLLAGRTLRPRPAPA